MAHPREKHFLKPGVHYLQGSQACAEGAIMAGCRVYAGYPITPASEIMEHAALRFPQVGGRFIQMEDEISSASVLLGASWAGAKTMTATSSPGFSLMQEVISFAIMTETPLVIVDVQRPGPGQGYITTSQEDVMQARWGHHGEGSIIALSPSSVQEMFEFTIEAFNLAEHWRSPVLLMAEETVAHMRERVLIPPREKIRIVNRKKPQDMGITPEEYLPYGHDTIPPMANWGEGYNVNHVGLVHYADGKITQYNPEMHFENVYRIQQKIENNISKIARLEAKFIEGCRHLVICYGSVSRTAIEAVIEAREDHGIDIGYLRLITLWPFAEEQLRKVVKKVDSIFVPEMNLGMMKHPITEALRDRCKKIIAIPSLGSLHAPEDILGRICKELK
ncbi:MAG: 2-oxoacid:acceptor oxidoreductase subunit alpha [Desulfobacterales bacterium]|nr:MAG: 2-oxoacid:acceptor oxidoreductase subunit alpha [Desulfobacterales bacterium]